MKKSLFTLFMALLGIQCLSAQTSLFDQGRFSVSLGVGYAPFSGTGQLVKHFEKYGFDDESINNFFFSSGSEHPDRMSFPFISRLWLSFRLRQNSRAGLTIGTDALSKVTGFDYRGSHYASLSHFSWFVVPTYSHVLGNGRWSLTGGPALNFQIIRDNTEWDATPEKKKTSVGALLGIDFHITKNLGLFFNARWLPQVHFVEHSKTYEAGGMALTSTLPAADVNFSYLSLGLKCRLTFEDGIILLMEGLAPRSEY